MEQRKTEIRPHAPDILIVDDTPANLQLLMEMLKAHGYTVRPVPNGELALQAIRIKMPDLILLDINMPEMNGYEVCEQLKADEALKEIPVLFISARDEVMDKVKAFNIGGVDYVTKPFQFEEVEARVQTHLKLRLLQMELEHRNSQLQENIEHLKKLEDLQENLTQMIVHDMRAPLMGITGYLELLEMDAGKKLTEDELQMLKDARCGGLVLVSMVNSLLDVSRLEQGEMPLNITDSDADALIQRALKSLGSLTGIDAPLSEKTEPVMVHCDADVTTRIIANLVGNAIKFSKEGGDVIVSVERHEAGIRFSVTDHGRGIPAEYHRKIFEKFGQVENRNEGKMYSTGLGLAFCKLAVEAQGGEMGVESEVGRGSTFWFTLPA